MYYATTIRKVTIHVQLQIIISAKIKPTLQI